MVHAQKNKIDMEAVERAVSFIENLKHTKGEWAGKPFKLAQWQRDEIIVPLFVSYFASAWTRIGRVVISSCHQDACLCKSRPHSRLELYPLERLLLDKLSPLHQ